MISLSKLPTARKFSTITQYIVNTRLLSTSPTWWDPYAKGDAEEFRRYFPGVVEDVKSITADQDPSEMQDVADKFHERLLYNLPRGKRLMGLTTVTSYKHLEKPQDLTPENVRLANILGWCVELFQTSFTMFDDVMENPNSVSQVPCLLDGEGIHMNPICEAILLEQYVFFILRKYFRHHVFYPPMVEAFHEVYEKSMLGKYVDGTRQEVRDISMNRFQTIARYKRAYYSFYLPVVLGMCLSKTYTEEMINRSRHLLLDMGEFAQIQNDFDDCYGNPEVKLKGETDIKQGKCTWLAAMALRAASPNQRKVLEGHYGQPTGESVRAVRELYDELDLRVAYSCFEKESFDSKYDAIKRFELPQRELFLRLLRKLYRNS